MLNYILHYIIFILYFVKQVSTSYKMSNIFMNNKSSDVPKKFEEDDDDDPVISVVFMFFIKYTYSREH